MQLVFYPHLTDEKKALRGHVICLRSHSLSVVEVRLDSEPLEGRTHDILASESCRSSPDGDDDNTKP